jgi:hypothetical protein
MSDSFFQKEGILQQFKILYTGRTLKFLTTKTTLTTSNGMSHLDPPEGYTAYRMW